MDYNKKLDHLQKKYHTLLNKQQFEVANLDYSQFEKQLPLLNDISNLNNSGVTVFDMYKKEHIYSSYNMYELFGFKSEKLDTDYYNSRVHPQDLLALTEVGIAALSFIISLSPQERKHFKFQNSYRIRNSRDCYVRINEQFLVLKQDKKGNIWLALSYMDLSPEQDLFDGIRSYLINTKSGTSQLFTVNQTSLPNLLSQRESEILSYVDNGLLSKEISDKLSISLNTVNTHRQNILKKLKANNSIEAIKFAKKLGLI